MAITGKREFHPALLLYALTWLLLSLAVLLGFISLFVPWVQKEYSPGIRVYSYPFKTCYVSTFSKAHQETCMDNDFIVGAVGAPVTGSNPKCKLFLITSIAMGFTGIIGAWLITFGIAAVMWRLWSRPIVLAGILQFLTVLVPSCTICSIAIFVAYAEYTCAVTVTRLFPVHGYSYGFICLVISTALSTSAVVVGFLAIKKLKRYQPLQLDEQEKDIYLEEQVPVDGIQQENHPLAAPTPVPTTESQTPVVFY